MYTRVFNVCLLIFAILSVADSQRGPLKRLNDGHRMPSIALGTWLGNSSTGSTMPQGYEVEYAILVAVDAGYRHIDTAWSYNVEDQVGRAVKTVVDEYNKRKEITTTPKVCSVKCYLNSLKDKMRLREGIPAIPPEELFITTKLWNDAHARSAVIPALEASLSKLEMSYVHLYLMHWPIGQFANQSYDTTHYLDAWRGMMDAQEANLTLSIGVSNFNQSMLENLQIHLLKVPAVLQIEWNLNLQQPKLLQYCRRHNIAVMGYTPFGSLMNKHRGGAPTHVSDPTLQAMARKYNKTVPQILLRFAVERGVTPIPRSLNPDRIEEYYNIFDFKLLHEDRQTLQTYDRGYRTVPQLKWRDHPFYPFEVVPDTTTTSTLTSVHVTSFLDGMASRMYFREIKEFREFRDTTRYDVV